MSQLALLGGTPAVRDGFSAQELADLTRWPVVTPQDEAAVLRVLRGSGPLSSGGDGEHEVPELERAWAAATGVPFAAAVASGTAALELAVRALRLPAGAEVIVPALTMNATALAVRLAGAAPVFADIDPVTYNLDPASAAAAVTARTGALLPVHLHGLPADMDALTGLARRRGLAVIEDAAQAHGARYNGRAAGSLGDAGCFSLHPSKNLPSCGEGGLVTTSSPALHEAVCRLRMFGERLEPGRPRSYVTHETAGNHRLSAVEAAFTRSQLTRFDADRAAREPAVRRFADRLGRLPGLLAPVVPAGCTHAWHILRFRLAPERLGMDGLPAPAVRAAFHRVLRAEGVPVSRYQVAPLPAHPAFAAGGEGGGSVADRFPVAAAVLDDSLCLQRRHLNPAAAPVLDAYANAFEKVWEALGTVRRIAEGRARAGRPGPVEAA